MGTKGKEKIAATADKKLGLVLVCRDISERSTKLIDARGAEVIAAIGGDQELFGDYLPHTSIPKYGVVDASGKNLAEPIWEGAEVVSPDLIKITAGGKRGLADKTGKILIEPNRPRLWPCTAAGGKAGTLGFCRRPRAAAQARTAALTEPVSTRAFIVWSAAA